ncbi:MAG: hypothetical protein ACKO0Z_13390 [Betaproteobacteria bacterium]
MKTLKSLKSGDYFRRKATGKVLVRGPYDIGSKTFCCHYFDDVNKFVYLKGSTEVITDFTF